MRVAVQAVGSDGDIRPLIALGAGLRRAGHRVVVATHDVSGKDYSGLCAEHDLDYVRLDAQPLLDADRLNVAEGASWAIEFYKQLWTENAHEEKVFDLAMSLCTDNDVMVSHYLSYPSKAAAIKTGTRHVAVQLTHEHTPTRHRPQVGTLPDLGERLNPVMWAQLMEMFDGATRHCFEGFWTRKGLPPFDHVWSLYFSDVLNLLAVSPTLCEPQPDWGGLHVVTGMLDFPDEGPYPDMSDELRRFLEDGVPPIFMTFGSATNIYPGSDRVDNLTLLVNAAQAAGCRAVVQALPDRDAEDMSYPTPGDDIFVVGRIPYAQIFPLCSVIVHHGGAGTCHLAMRSDRPSVVLPFTGHHWFLGYELHRLGLAPFPLMMHEMTVGKLADLLRHVQDDPSYQRCASAVGVRVRREDGVAKAVRAIEALDDSRSVLRFEGDAAR